MEAITFGTEVSVSVAEGYPARRGYVLDSFAEGGHLWYRVELHPTESQYGRTITARAVRVSYAYPLFPRAVGA
jgi:hypothetical protein